MILFRLFRSIFSTKNAKNDLTYPIYACMLLFLLCSCSEPTVDIPDTNFKDALLHSNCIDTDGIGKGDRNADLNNDKQIQVSEIENLEYLDVSAKNIKSLEGIRNFVNLKILDCYKNELVGLDVSKNTKLQDLFCYDNQLKDLDVSKNKDLVKLGCRGNKITSLDLSQNKKLKVLYAYKNNLTSLNIRNGNNANMTAMWAFDNPDLSAIEVDGNKSDFPLCDKDNYTGWCKNSISLYRAEAK